jgi:hypothetical protein
VLLRHLFFLKAEMMHICCCHQAGRIQTLQQWLLLPSTRSVATYRNLSSLVFSSDVELNISGAGVLQGATEAFQYALLFRPQLSGSAIPAMTRSLLSSTLQWDGSVRLFFFVFALGVS